MPTMSPRIKHIAISYHFFRTKVKEFEIDIVPINTNDQLSDQFTRVYQQKNVFAIEKFLWDGKLKYVANDENNVIGRRVATIGLNEEKMS